jgi:hypothetical protein
MDKKEFEILVRERDARIEKLIQAKRDVARLKKLQLRTLLQEQELLTAQKIVDDEPTVEIAMLDERPATLVDRGIHRLLHRPRRRLISTCCGGRDVTPREITISALGDNCGGRGGVAEQRVTFKKVGWLRRMSVLDDFVRKRDFRKRAAEYEQAAADPSLPTNVRTRFVLIANHYRVLADWDERTERARWRAKAEARQIPARYRYAAE